MSSNAYLANVHSHDPSNKHTHIDERADQKVVSRSYLQKTLNFTSLWSGNKYFARPWNSSFVNNYERHLERQFLALARHLERTTYVVRS